MNKVLLFAALYWFSSLVIGEDLNMTDLDCGVTVDYVGNSGQFKLESDCSTAFLKVKMNSIIEYDGGSGDKTNNKVTSFANQDYQWITDDGENSTYQGLNAVQNTYLATLLVGTGAPSTRAEVPFSLTTILFLEEGSIDVNGDSVNVDDNSLKWTIEIENWPFDESTDANNSNTLEICMSITSGGNGNDFDLDIDLSGNNTDDTIDIDSEYSVSLGDFSLLLEDMVEIDGELTDGVSITMQGATGEDEDEDEDEEDVASESEDEDEDAEDEPVDDGDGARRRRRRLEEEEEETSLTFCFTFDEFSNTLVYDPIVSYDSLPDDGSDSNNNNNGDNNDGSDSSGGDIGGDSDGSDNDNGNGNGNGNGDSSPEDGNSANMIGLNMGLFVFVFVAVCVCIVFDGLV